MILGTAESNGNAKITLHFLQALLQWGIRWRSQCAVSACCAGCHTGMLRDSSGILPFNSHDNLESEQLLLSSLGILNQLLTSLVTVN